MIPPLFGHGTNDPTGGKVCFERREMLIVVQGRRRVMAKVRGLGRHRSCHSGPPEGTRGTQRGGIVTGVRGRSGNRGGQVLRRKQLLPKLESLGRKWSRGFRHRVQGSGAMDIDFRQASYSSPLPSTAAPEMVFHSSPSHAPTGGGAEAEHPSRVVVVVVLVHGSRGVHL